MTDEKIKEALELQAFIKETSQALEEVKAFLGSKGCGSLNISQFGDGSGLRIRLVRAEGNRDVLEGIKVILERQLDIALRMFEAL